MRSIPRPGPQPTACSRGRWRPWQLEVVQLQELREPPPEEGERSVVVFMSTSLEKDIKELRNALLSVDRCVRAHAIAFP
jgi:hypothetical protein